MASDGEQGVAHDGDPGPMVFSYNEGHWSIGRPITSYRNECRPTDRTGKQTNHEKWTVRK